MESIAHIFDIFVKLALIGVAVAVVVVFLYFRWRAAGQERGI